MALCNSDLKKRVDAEDAVQLADRLRNQGRINLSAEQQNIVGIGLEDVTNFCLKRDQEWWDMVLG